MKRYWELFWATGLPEAAAMVLRDRETPPPSSGEQSASAGEQSASANADERAYE